MGKVIDLGSYKAGIQQPGEGIIDELPAEWLEDLVSANFKDNLTRVAEVAGESAVLPINVGLVSAHMAKTQEDPAPFGVLRTEIRRGRVGLTVSNRLALLFADLNIPEDDGLARSGKLAALFATGALVATSSWLIEPIGSENPIWWDDNLHPDKREIYRFAGGVVVNKFGFKFPAPKVRRNRNAPPITPQQAGLINPLSANEMRKYFNFAPLGYS